MNKTHPPSEPRGAEGSPSLLSYLRANLFFYAFLCLAALLTFLATGRVWDDVFRDTARFLFLIVGGAFTLASFFDYFYRKYEAKNSDRSEP